MNKGLFSTILLLFIIVVLWIANDMELISIPFLNRQKVSPSRDIGKVIKQVKSVQRRSRDSFAWDDLSEEEMVFNYDSVITLEKSEALLKLNNGVDLDIGENTLIALLPPENQQDVITINLKSGSYKLALHKGKQIRVSGVLLKATEDSTLNLKAKDGSHTSVSVITGAVDTTNTGSPIGTVKAGQDITIDELTSSAQLVEPAPIAPPPQPVEVQRKTEKRKPATIKAHKKPAKPTTQVRKMDPVENPKSETTNKRADPESMSQDLSELPDK